ncbi:MAG: YfhO family protein [Bacteroidia bacterium]
MIVAAYFSPVIFSGKVVDQHDIKQFEGMAKESRDFRAQTGEEALWVSTLFSGMPAFQTSIEFPNNWITPINKLLWLGLPRPAGYIFVTFLGFYLLLLVLRVNPWLSAVGAAAYAFSSYFFIILDAGHTSKANAISFMAPVLAGVILTYRGDWKLGGALTALAVALEVNANHLQITYYLAIAIAMLGVAYLIEAIVRKNLPSFAFASGILLLAAVVGTGPNIGRLWTTSEYAAETMRGKAVLKNADGQAQAGLDIEYALRWSYGVSESLTLLVPNLYGGASAVNLGKNSTTAKEVRKRFGNSAQVNQLIENWPSYWGSQPGTSGPVYVGALVCFLFVLGLMVVRGPMQWWLIAATLLFLVLSWGRNFMVLTELFFSYFPGYNKFRAVSMMLVIVELTMPLLGILGLQQLLDQAAQVKDTRGLQRKVIIAAGISGGLALLIALLGFAGFMSFEGEEDAQRFGDLLPLVLDYRASALTGDALRSVFFIAVGAGLIWLYLNRSLRQSALLYAGLGLVVLADMIPVALRYLNDDSYVSAKRYASAFEPTQADNFILQDKDPNYRVFNFAAREGSFNDARTSYYHKSVGGYHAAKLRRYQDLIDRHLQREMQIFITTLRTQPTDSSVRATLSGLHVFNMLNTRYFILDESRAPIQNLFAMGNAWFVQGVQQVNSPDEEIAAMNTFDPKRTAIVDVAIEGGAFGKQLEGLAPGSDSTARIALTDWKPNQITYQTQISREGIAVFSEIYYNDGKGWQAYIDDQPVPHFRANYVLRGLRVPAGTHTVRFSFEPRSYFVGEQIDLVFSILLMLVIAAAAYFEVRRWRSAA